MHRMIRRRLVAALAGIAAAVSSVALALPRVVSINLCTDQLLLNLAAPEQVLSLSWLASDPHESMLAAEARHYPANYGTAEEVLAHDPDVVLAGSYTGLFTRRLLARLGYAVHEVPPASGLDDIERSIVDVGRVIGREHEAAAVLDAFRRRRETIAARADGLRVAVVRPGGFTIERDSLAHELVVMAGVRNVASESGLDRWGSLPIEALVRLAPDVIAISRYELTQPSLADGILDHPALRAAATHVHTVQVPTRYWACGLPQSLDSVELLLEGLAAIEPGAQEPSEAPTPERR